MKYFFTLLLSLILQSPMIHPVKATLIYIGDPMCSWCYGFSPELSKVMDNLEKGVDLRLVMGGLRPYNTETMKELGDFLNGHWKEVQERSGQSFGYDILKDHSFIYDTEPPSRAVLVVRKLNPEKEFAFFKAVQTAFYADNKNTHLVDTYMELAEQMDIDPTAFKTAFESEEMKDAVRRDFEWAAEMGVRGFPTLLLQIGEKYHLIANGYRKAEQVEMVIKEQIKQNH